MKKLCYTKQFGVWDGMYARLGLAFLLLGTAPVLFAAQNSNAPAQPTFQSFHIISDRNIFNASRSGGRVSRRGQQRVVKIDSFKLLGTMSYEKGRFAIFGGTSPEYRKIIQTAESIGDYKLADVGPNSIKLTTSNSQVIEMRVGSQIKRQDNGPWSLSNVSEPIPVSSATAAPTTTSDSSSSPAAASSGPENDVLKRLMQKREQELKK